MTLEEKVDQALISITRVEQSLQLTVRALKLIMTELGIRKKLIEISDEIEAMEARDSSTPPPRVGS